MKFRSRSPKSTWRARARNNCAGCTKRGTTRAEADITNPAAIHAAIERVDPWAVVNATGYVRVDDAEREPDACSGVNTVGAAHVAAACRQRGLLVNNVRPNAIRLMPPLNVTDDEIDRACDIIEEAVMSISAPPK